MKVNVDSPDDISLLMYQAHEEGAAIKAYNTNPCSLCNANADIHFHGSEVGACSRKTYYFKVYGKQDQGFNSTTFFSDGHLHEASMLRNIEQGLPEGYKIRILENSSEQITELLGFKLVTHCDAFLIAPDGTAYVIECKALKPKYFKEIKETKEIRDGYYGQLQSYMFVNKCETGIFVIKNREDSKIMFPITMHKDVEYMGKRIGKLSEVFTSIKNDGTIPAREHRTDKEFECNFCPFKKLCWSV